ncbi:MAG: hypothetical protein GX208_05410 [Firmicutes bacterium]|nr:hypothetical protein [Bacillota bacterium]
MKRWIWLVVLVLLFTTGCDVARLSLIEGEFRIEDEYSVLDIPLGNKGVPIYIDTTKTTVRDSFGNEYQALEHTGNLGENFGDDYLESVSGSIIFPKIDPSTRTVQVKITTRLVSGERSHVSMIRGKVEDGVSTNLTF